jgi:hypothetical protein
MISRAHHTSWMEREGDLGKAHLVVLASDIELVRLVPILALPNIWQELAANFLIHP